MITHETWVCRTLGTLGGVVVETSEGELVSSVQSSYEKRAVSSATTLRRGHLIASAPDLLALLVELTDIEGPLPGNSEWGRKVRSAIAKAAGENA